MWYPVEHAADHFDMDTAETFLVLVKGCEAGRPSYTIKKACWIKPTYPESSIPAFCEPFHGNACDFVKIENAIGFIPIPYFYNADMREAIKN